MTELSFANINAAPEPPLVLNGRTKGGALRNQPNATNISVREVLGKLDAEFAPMAVAVENGEFALWVGSGISRRAPDLGDLIARAMEHLRQRAVDPKTSAAFEPAFFEALKLAQVEPDAAQPYFNQEFQAWKIAESIKDELWNKYSRLLDIRVPGQRGDYLLWEAVDIRAAFQHPNSPAAQHLAIAILIMEGAVRDIASANWDGFIEAAVAKLSSGAADSLVPVVDPGQLRAAAGKPRLLKFHGCIVYGTEYPNDFRKYLTGSHTQIVEWPNNKDFEAMRAAITALATNMKSLVLGLSIQDANLQGIFSAAKQVNPWPWPSAPNAPGHVFCEDEIKAGQRDVLKVVYGEAYNHHILQIEAGTHLRAWAEQVLVALVLKLLTDKLSTLIDLKLAATALSGATPAITAELTDFRDLIAGLAIGDRTVFAEQAIATWSRLLALYRSGALATDRDAYQVLSASRPNQLAADHNAQAAGLGDMGIALALLHGGKKAGLWALGPPFDTNLTSGALAAKAAWPGATERPVFLVRGAGEAIALRKAGAFANDNAIVIHSDDAWSELQGVGAGTGAPSPRRLRTPPGRTGVLETRHVSLQTLVARSADFDDLRSRFVSEVTL